MTDSGDAPSVLVQRLHEARIAQAMTVQQMAEKCGIPKSSMESYMRMAGAKRPGIDALVAIATGMNVSIDWLVGPAVDNMPPSLGQRDYALRCFAVVQLFILWLHKKQEAAPSTTIIQGDRIAGIEDAELAARSMILFVEDVRKYTQTHRRADDRSHAWSLFDRIEEAVKEPATGN